MITANTPSLFDLLPPPAQPAATPPVADDGIGRSPEDAAFWQKVMAAQRMGRRDRPYQVEAIEGGARGPGVRACLAKHPSTLVVSATGTGKGRLIGMTAALFPRRVLILQHREELLRQNMRHVAASTGEKASIEKAEYRAHHHARVIVSTPQTLVSGRGKTFMKPPRDWSPISAPHWPADEPFAPHSLPFTRVLRMERLDPAAFDAVIVDEAHRVRSRSYERILAYFTRGNPDLKVILFTATPKRHDKKRLAKVCASMAFYYPVGAAIDDGYLVPTEWLAPKIGGMDLSGVSVSNGDFNESELAGVMEFEGTLQGIAQVTIEEAFGLPQGFCSDLLDRHVRCEGCASVPPPGSVPLGADGVRRCPRCGGECKGSIELARPALAEAVAGRRGLQTLMFCVSVAQAERQAEILNRWLPRSAASVSGETDADDRRRLFHDFGAGAFRFLANVDVATEGTDVPGIEMLVMARPTLSLARFEQMFGRGVRPHDSIADALSWLETPGERRRAISLSPKPMCKVIDPAGNSGKHKLVSLPDVLGQDMPEEVRERAKRKAAEGAAATPGVPSDVRELLRLAQSELDQAAQEEKAQEERERARRQGLVGKVEYQIGRVDPFELYDVRRPKAGVWGKQQPASRKQMERLQEIGAKYGFEVPPVMAAGEAGRLIQEYRERITPKQLGLLMRKGKFDRKEINRLSSREASRLIDRMDANGWRRDAAAQPAAAPTAIGDLQRTRMNDVERAFATAGLTEGVL